MEGIFNVVFLEYWMEQSYVYYRMDSVMVKVEMPQASWEIVMFYLKDLDAHGFPQAGAVAKEISTQVYSQEY